MDIEDGKLSRGMCSELRSNYINIIVFKLNLPMVLELYTHSPHYTLNLTHLHTHSNPHLHSHLYTQSPHYTLNLIPTHSLTPTHSHPHSFYLAESWNSPAWYIPENDNTFYANRPLFVKPMVLDDIKSKKKLGLSLASGYKSNVSYACVWVCVCVCVCA